MFNSLSGTITQKSSNSIFLDTNGIEWEILVPSSAVGEFPNPGEKARVFVWLNHTENSMTLFGFASENERRLFFDLNKVDGVGPKSALKILGSVSSSKLVSALESEDLASLEKIPGLGRKTAQKMLLALKGKLSISEEIAVRNQKCAFPDVADALSNMGYDKKQAENTVNKIYNTIKNDISNKTAKEIEDIVFRKAIVEMAN